MCHFNPKEKSLKKILLLLLLITSFGFAQKKSASQKNVFVDKNGILRWEGSNKEVSLYGVNYTTPFAYSYRAQKKLGLNLKQAIDLDVGQVVRLGLDAFHVHVWDRQISDKVENIIDNDHLNLFDYLIYKLEANHIKIIVTPIAWGELDGLNLIQRKKDFLNSIPNLSLLLIKMRERQKGIILRNLSSILTLF